jgi:hypothetical protein
MGLMPSFYRRPRVTVSGSFRRSLREIEDAVALLGEAGAEVVSPEDPHAMGELDGFVFVASDRTRVISLLQQRHFAAIRASDYLWVVAPEGRIGVSVSMEIGHALACGVPVFCSHRPQDLGVLAVVEVAASPISPLSSYVDVASGGQTQSALLDPERAVDEGNRLLTDIGSRLTGKPLVFAPTIEDPVVRRAATDLTRMMNGLVEPRMRLRSAFGQ